jgi:hypothetical protein
MGQRYSRSGRRRVFGLVTYEAMSRPLRRALVPIAVAIAAIGPLIATVPAPASPSDQDLIDLACSLPHRYLVRTWEGFSPDRGPELTAIPKEPNFMGAGLPHASRHPALRRVPRTGRDLDEERAGPG